MTSRDRSPIRRLADSTRRALTARTSAAAGLNTAQRLNERFLSTARDVAPRFGSQVEQLRSGYASQAGITDPDIARPRAAGTLYEPLVPLDVDTRISGERPRPQADVGRISGERPRAPEGVDTSDLLDQIQNQINIDIAARDQAIAEGQADVAAAYDEQIAKLKEQQAKLKIGRASINTAYAGQQDLLQGQATELAAASLGETGTDVEAEVGKVSTIFDSGRVELNAFLDKIGADNPALGRQLGADIAQFSTLAEEQLRQDLGSQARITRAAGLFAQKAGESLIAAGAVDAEQSRSKIEAEINAKINNLADGIKDAEKQKAAAIDKVRDAVGDYDSSWLQDEEQVWGAVLDEWFGGKDLNFEDEAEARAFFDDVYFNLPDRTRAGATEWAKSNVFQVNFGQILDNMGVGNSADLVKALVGRFQASGLTGDLEAKANDAVTLLEGIARNGTMPENFQQLLGFALEGPLDFVNLDDYTDLIDMVELREDFVGGGYEEFVNSVNARLAGSGVSANAIDGSQLTIQDMAKVRSGSSTGYVHPGAAPQFNQMVAAAAEAGITLGFSDTYRSWATQNQAYQHFLRTGRNLNKHAGNDFQGDKVPNIAHPNSSNHPRGLAIDFTLTENDATHKWLKENGTRYGWFPIANEPWHWEYRGDIEPRSDSPQTVAAPLVPRTGGSGGGQVPL